MTTCRYDDITTIKAFLDSEHQAMYNEMVPRVMEPARVQDSEDITSFIFAPTSAGGANLPPDRLPAIVRAATLSDEENACACSDKR